MNLPTNPELPAYIRRARDGAGTTHINTGPGYTENQGCASYVFVTPEIRLAKISLEECSHPRKMYRRSIKVGGVTVPLYFVVELHGTTQTSEGTP